MRAVATARYAAARRRGFVVKLIAAATTHEDATIEADVRPRLVPADAPMARVQGAMNASTLDAEYAGSLAVEGPEAGPDAAASPVLAGLVPAANGVPAA